MEENVDITQRSIQPPTTVVSRNLQPSVKINMSDDYEYELDSIESEYQRKNSKSSGTPSSQTDSVEIIIDTNANNLITIENIQEEDNLIEYTKNHFNNQIKDDLRKINQYNKSQNINTNCINPRVYSLENIGDFLKSSSNTNEFIEYYTHPHSIPVEMYSGTATSRSMQDNIFDNEFNNNYIRSNSPISISNTGSYPGSFRGSNSGSDNENDMNDDDSNYGSYIDQLYDIHDVSHCSVLETESFKHFHTETNSGHETIKLAASCPLNDSNNKKKIKKYKQFAYTDIEKIIDKYYDDDIDNKYSSDIDILTTYMKGQKNLYIHSHRITHQYLNYLRFPALIFTALVTIIAPFIECQPGSGGVISAINAIAAFLMSLINYLKLESSSEMFLQIATQYDKMQSSLEMTNNKLVVLDKEEEQNALVLNKIKEIEKKMIEIKESNTLLIPVEIKLQFPIICHINIFSFIKKIELYKKKLVSKFKDVKNEIRYILYKWEKNVKFGRTDNNNYEHIERLKEKNRLLFLYDVKKKLKTEILDYRGAYGNIDELFTQEIKRAESIKINWLNCFLYKFGNPTPKIDFVGINPVVDKYFHFIFADE